MSGETEEVDRNVVAVLRDEDDQRDQHQDAKRQYRPQLPGAGVFDPSELLVLGPAGLPRRLCPGTCVTLAYARRRLWWLGHRLAVRAARRAGRLRSRSGPEPLGRWRCATVRLCHAVCVPDDLST